MLTSYEMEANCASSEPFINVASDEFLSLPEITTLDDYLHFRDQLETMRARSTNFIPARFAMEIALLARLNEYDERIGLPRFPMPDPDGKGGIKPVSIVPVSWRLSG